MKNRNYYIRQTLLIAGMTIICAVFLIPLIFMVTLSFQSQDVIMEDGGAKLFPSVWTFDNYITIFNTANSPIFKWLMNSLIVAFLSALLTILIASMSAFAYARLKFKGRKWLFNALLLTMMIPSVVSLIPNYMTISALGLKNTLTALIIPMLGAVTNVFLIRQFLFSIPKELDEAALIDGANYFRLFFRIILPQMVPILVVVGLNTFLAAWNDVLWPLVINPSIDARTITAGMENIERTFEENIPCIMAATLISSLPVLIIYMFAQKYLIKGISLTSGMKE